MKLKDFFIRNDKVALAFSGGVDSSYLLYAGKKYGADIMPYFIKTPFQPEFELEDAKALASSLGVRIKLIELDNLSIEEVARNLDDRCYYCKKTIFNKIIEEAGKDGYNLIVDGTNASDSYDDRPGMKAIQELGVVSPLREAGLTKEDIRKLSREAGLFTGDKPSYSCLATRIFTGQRIRLEDLKKAEEAEKFLMDMGFKDFRVRVRDKDARLEFKSEDMEKAFKVRKEIYETLSINFETVSLDLGGR